MTARIYTITETFESGINKTYTGTLAELTKTFTPLFTAAKELKTYRGARINEKPNNMKSLMSSINAASYVVSAKGLPTSKYSFKRN